MPHFLSRNPYHPSQLNMSQSLVSDTECERSYKVLCLPQKTTDARETTSEGTWRPETQSGKAKVHLNFAVWCSLSANSTHHEGPIYPKHRFLGLCGT